LQAAKAAPSDGGVLKPTIRARADAAVPGLAITNTREYAKQQLAAIMHDAEAALDGGSPSRTDGSTQARVSVPAGESTQADVGHSRDDAVRTDGSRNRERSREARSRDAGPSGRSERSERAGGSQRRDERNGERERRRNRDGRDGHHSERSSDRDRERHRNREHGRVGDRGRDRRHDRGENGDRDRERNANGNRDGESGHSGRDRHDRDDRDGLRRHEDGGRHGGGRAALPPPPARPPAPQLDAAPQPYKVYRGRVSSTTRAGAFVELLGVAGKVDGMVHISNMSARRVVDIGEVCARGQEVWVKVLAVQEPKPGQSRPRIELSMRDVDQSTGQDLLPLHAEAKGGLGASPNRAA
jgi:predicted RNA-binding protein with RPS1 domain